MKIQKFIVKDNEIDFEYHVVINQIKIDGNKLNLTYLFEFIDKFQGNFPNAILQFFNSTYILNEKHVFSAAYYAQKAFQNDLNIANTKNIELFLYLAASRQIKVALDRFGLTDAQLEQGKITYCIITKQNQMQEMNEFIMEYLSAEEISYSINNQSQEKLDKIKDIFEISDAQLTSALKSQAEANKSLSEIKNDPFWIAIALHELICEKMAILSLEKVSLS